METNDLQKKIESLVEEAYQLNNDEQTWKATPLLEQAILLLSNVPDTEENQEWLYEAWYAIGECYYTNQRRQQAKHAYQQALVHATSAGLDTDDCDYQLDRIKNPLLKYDPIEDSVDYLAVIDEVEHKLYDELKGEPRHMGFCFRYWSLKRSILATYGIEWRSPGIMNPHVHFD